MQYLCHTVVLFQLFLSPKQIHPFHFMLNLIKIVINTVQPSWQHKKV